jgi:hypothetical protein
MIRLQSFTALSGLATLAGARTRLILLTGESGPNPQTFEALTLKLYDRSPRSFLTTKTVLSVTTIELKVESPSLSPKSSYLTPDPYMAIQLKVISLVLADSSSGITMASSLVRSFAPDVLI